MEVFFYGLFMDVAILSKSGIEATNVRMGYLQDYTLKIGNRASLIPANGERAHGLLMTVGKTAIQKLYKEQSVADYIPEEVSITTNKNDVVKAVCYNLPLTQLSGTNPTYALSLFELSSKLGFPTKYLEHIKKMTGL